MFIEIHPGHFIDLTEVKEIKPSGNKTKKVSIDGKLYEYDSEEDRDLMLERIKYQLLRMGKL